MKRSRAYGRSSKESSWTSITAAGAVCFLSYGHPMSSKKPPLCSLTVHSVWGLPVVGRTHCSTKSIACQCYGPRNVKRAILLMSISRREGWSMPFPLACWPPPRNSNAGWRFTMQIKIKSLRFPLGYLLRGKGCDSHLMARVPEGAHGYQSL
ncbi:hypothetical protein IW261DRAFT_103276 [Armillaria novae-zelandiae]|uniref:Uncharacterized protein n=1 Tax=Armillaria novae-zelandiae TaxID=153914 RepID=A0AA39PW47_9AGAR|nr:hypothetical protein IW261DRAFT_103276 [Armillaria novae-zelandiae]